MAQYTPVYGTITSISPVQTNSRRPGCTLHLSVMTQDMGPVTLVLTPSTYVEGQTTFRPGDSIVAFYDGSAPVPLIYPPRFEAIVMAETDEGRFAAFDYFNWSLVNSDNTLRLNLSQNGGTDILTANGQTYLANPANHYLLVLYTAATRSIPAMTTPEKVIVFCSEED